MTYHYCSVTPRRLVIEPSVRSLRTSGTVDAGYHLFIGLSCCPAAVTPESSSAPISRLGPLLEGLSQNFENEP